MLTLVLLAPLALSVPQDAPDRAWPNHGLHLQLADGWDVIDETEEDGGLIVRIAPSSEAGVSLSVSLQRAPAGATATSLRDTGVEGARGNAAIEALEPFEDQVGGEPAPALRAEFPQADGRLRIEQFVRVANGRLLVVENRAPVAAFAAFEVDLRAMRASLVLEDVVREETDEDRLRAIAARVVEDLPWAASWEAAAARAVAENKPIFVRVFMYSGFAMGDAEALAPFADPDLAALVRESVVPFRLGKGTKVPFSDPALYGIGPMGFGSGYMIASPAGEVLAEAVNEPETFLREWLALEADAEEAAPVTAREFHRLGRAKLRERDAGAARAAFARAGELAAEAGDDGLRFELTLDAHVLTMREGNLAHLGEDVEATSLARALAQSPEHPRAGEARFVLVETAFALGERDDALDRLRALALDRPDDRWGWHAANLLRVGGIESVERTRASWPDPAVVDSLRRVEPAPLTPEEVELARTTAREWLVASQRPDGSWITPTETTAAEGDEPGVFVISATAIATRALLPHVGRGDVQVAIGAGHAFLTREAKRVEEESERPVFMDYRCWSHPLELRLCAALARGGWLDPAHPDALFEHAIAGMTRLQKDDGGWGYYVTGDLSKADGPPTPSMSFTTAGALLALLDAREAGFEIPDALIEGAIRHLEATRNEDGTFEYWLTGGPRPGAAVGAAGRAPVCTLALVRAGATEAADLSPALALFSEHRASLAAETGKLLMHCGPGGLGSHYPFYDYLGAAESLAHLPEAERGRRRLELLEVLLAARGADGSYLDNPLIGRATATGLALLALDAAGQ